MEKEKEQTEEPGFFCFECGSQLQETRLSFYECVECSSQFLAFKSEGNQCFENVFDFGKRIRNNQTSS